LDETPLPGPITGTITKIGNVCIVTIDTISGTADSTNVIQTSPLQYTPKSSGTTYYPLMIWNNDVPQCGNLLLNDNGTLIISPENSDFLSGTSIGIRQSTFTYVCM